MIVPKDPPTLSFPRFENPVSMQFRECGIDEAQELSPPGGEPGTFPLLCTEHRPGGVLCNAV